MRELITHETMKKIEAVFMHCQFIDSKGSVQAYDPLQEYRYRVVFAKDIDWNMSCKWCFVNFPLDKIRAWHFKTWDKRKKEFPHENFVKIYEQENVIRFGFY